MTRIIALIATAIIIISTSAVAGDYNSPRSKSSAKQRQDASSSNDIDIISINKAAKSSVRTAYSPVAIPTSDCMGAVSAGGQGQFFGFSLGGTTQSKPCNIREDAKIQLMLGNEDLAYLIHACQDKKIRELTRHTDDPCPNLKKKKTDKPTSRPTYRK